MNKFLTITLTLLISFSSCSQTLSIGEQVTLVDSCGYFPQLSRDASMLLYAPTDASSLMLKNLTDGRVTTVATDGLPGFDARFAPDGRVYYITQALTAGNLVYRTARCYDPASGKNTVVVPAQHGAVFPIATEKGFAVVGEHKSWTTKPAGKYVYTRRSTLYIIDDKTVKTFSPAGDCAGYLWASLSPDGKKVMFEAAGKGLYICDLNGSVLHSLPPASMPVWFDNNHFVAMTNTNFGAQRINGTYIYMSSLDGTFSQPLTAPEEQAVQPMVVGNRVVYVATGGEVKMITVNLK